MKPSAFVLVASISFVTSAFSQVPSGNDISDGFANTGMGSHALGGQIAIPCNIGESSNAKCYNTAAGYAALGSDSTGGNYNTGIGFAVLYQNLAGFYNTASGAGALEQNTMGTNNTAIGFGALSSNILGDNNTLSTASFNTASGAQALYLNTSGEYNAASGAGALYSNTTGSYNTADGFNALYSNNSGTYNAAFGYQAMYSNQAGVYNLAAGGNALYFNANGYDNMALGYFALYNNQGNQNAAIGEAALYNNSSGSSNIGIGQHAGINLTTGSNNIDIGSPGAASESGVIRIGTITGTTSTQSATYIAGIYGNTAGGGLPVLINSNGLLGTVSSSQRFKTAIEPIGSSTEKLQQLRPVSFHYKADPHGTVQYGLIAEDVAKVYPELVVRDSNGRIDGVRYDELAPILLNEVQKQAAEIRDLESQRKVIDELQEQLVQLRTALAKVQAKDNLLAGRRQLMQAAPAYDLQ